MSSHGHSPTPVDLKSVKSFLPETLTLLIPSTLSMRELTVNSVTLYPNWSPVVYIILVTNIQLLSAQIAKSKLRHQRTNYGLFGPKPRKNP